MYLFGRTRTDPSTFFHRSLAEGRVWSPWKKIDLSINAPGVSPVYAYGRLFIFWSEVAAVNGSAVKDSTAEAQSTTQVSLKYSFYDATGDRIQPQTLVQDYVINAYPSNYDVVKDNLDISALFESSLLPWRTPHVFNIARGLPGTGRLTISQGSSTAIGINTNFPNQVKVGDRIRCAGQERSVTNIGGENNTELSVNDNWTMAANNAEFVVVPKASSQNTFPSFAGAGQITFTSDFNVVSGDADTNFPLQIAVGDRITAEGETRTVLIISAGSRQLTMDRNWGVGGTNVNYTITPQVIGVERLMIFFGTPLDTKAYVYPGDGPKVDDNPGRDPFIVARNKFNLDLFATLVLAGRIGSFTIPVTGTAVAGDVTCGFAITLTESLESQDNRVLCLDWQYSGVPVADLQPYRLVIDRNNSILMSP